MNAKFFVDENDLGLGRLLGKEYEDVVYPGHPALPQVPRGSLDDDWLRVIGELNLVVITRDRRIRYREAEKLAWIEHGVRGFVLTGTKSQRTVDSKTILDRHWNHINTIIGDNPVGPWMYAVTGQDVRPIELS